MQGAAKTVAPRMQMITNRIKSSIGEADRSLSDNDQFDIDIAARGL